MVFINRCRGVLHDGFGFARCSRSVDIIVLRLVSASFPSPASVFCFIPVLLVLSEKHRRYVAR